MNESLVIPPDAIDNYHHPFWQTHYQSRNGKINKISQMNSTHLKNVIYLIYNFVENKYLEVTGSPPKNFSFHLYSPQEIKNRIPQMEYLLKEFNRRIDKKEISYSKYSNSKFNEISENWKYYCLICCLL